MASRAKRKEVARWVQGMMGLAMFGCHCGDRHFHHKLEGHWLCTHLRNRHPQMLLSLREPIHVTYEVDGVNLLHRR